MKKFRGIICLFSILIFFNACQQEIEPFDPVVPPPPPPADSGTWVLSTATIIPYDIETGDIETSDVHSDSMVYSKDRLEMVIYSDKLPFNKFRYNAQGMLDNMYSYQNNAWVEQFKFNRNAGGNLVSTNYTYGNGPGTGTFAYGTAPSGKTIQFVDTAAGVIESGFYNAVFDSKGNVTEKHYQQRQMALIMVIGPTRLVTGTIPTMAPTTCSR